MSDVDPEQKTEEATPKKLQKLREQGQVANSADVTGIATVFGVMLVAYFIGTRLMRQTQEFTHRILSLEDVGAPFAAMSVFSSVFFKNVLPIAGGAAIAAIAAAYVQTKGLFVPNLLVPKPERMDPIKGIQKVIPTKDMLIELGKNLLKVFVVGVLVTKMAIDHIPSFAALPTINARAGMLIAADAALEVFLWGMAALAALAAFDYYIQLRKFQKDSKMAVHEIKDEYKESEGDPQLKGRRRAKQMEFSRNRSVQEVSNATVLVTNPTHISVAIRYDQESDPVPVMLSSGVEEIALRMRVEARKHGIPIVENRPLARALYASGKAGQPIPFELYEAAAKVIAHVMRIRGMIPASGGRS